MPSAKKFIAVASLAAAPLLVGGLTGAAVAHAAPATATANAAPATATAHTVHGATTPAPAPSGSSGSGTADPNAEQVTPEPDGAGGHADAPGANVDHQFSGVE
jgi:hypothetical protein